MTPTPHALPWSSAALRRLAERGTIEECAPLRREQPRIARGCDAFDGPVHHVGVDLAPEIGHGTAAEDSDRIERRSLAEALDVLVQPAGVHGDALEHGAHQVGTGDVDAHVVEAGASVAVVDG